MQYTSSYNLPVLSVVFIPLPVSSCISIIIVSYYKKTDYTYSPLSDQRYEIAPGFYNMPNLSRRPLGSYLSSVSKMQRNFSYNLAREDSDSEEYVDPRRYYKEETLQQFSIWQRVSLAVKTFFIFIYTYTFGALIGGVSYLANRIKAAFSAVRNTNERETKSYYYYRETVVSDNFATEEAITWKQKIAALFLMIWGGLSRNWGKLLGLLLLLLLAYAVYTVGWCSYLTDLYESSSLLHDSSNYMHKTGTLILDSVLNFWQRTVQIAVVPWQWLVEFTSALLNFLLSVLAAPFQVAIYFCGWFGAVGSSLAAKIQEPLFQSVEMTGESPSESENSKVPIVYNANPALVYENNIDIEELALRVLGTSAFQNLQNKQASFTEDIKSQALVFQKISGDISALDEKLEVLSSGVEKNEEKSQLLASIGGKIDHIEEELQQHYSHILGSSDCCDKMQAEIVQLQGKIDAMSQADQSHVAADLIQSQSELTEKLRERIQKLEIDLKAAQEKILANIDSKMEAAAKELAELRHLKTSTATNVGVQWDTSDEKLIALIRQQIAAFDADKTNLPDYALESSGGMILTTRCTESYDERNAFTYYLGMDWLYQRVHKPNNPRSIIQPSVNPGDCYAFKGATGIILIELSKKIHLTAVTMEHIPKTISLNGNIDSAPKDFSIWGFKEDQDTDPIQLGSFTYVDNGQALQTFEILVEHDSYQKVELRIESNHGHLEYTCIYRFRVHGVPV
ncbi:klaroid protein-like isoform X2 [Cloeon dipterum]|uniref:klaroid protein-like isoform X2 n=1 Tax=Cloeon dipterum TaxID=197152 RepID=UPI00321FB578